MSKLKAGLLPVAALTALTLAACTSGGTDSSEMSADTVGQSGSDLETGSTSSNCEVVPDGTFPISIDHVYGTTTITEEPERIAAVSWYNQEVPLALGVAPIGMAPFFWGDDDGDGILPWVAEKLDDLGAEKPLLFDETDGINFEAVAAAEPDVILASYSGITQEQYDTLSKIAPTVAYPDIPWGTSMADMICMNANAIGLSTSGAELYQDLEAQIAAALDENPELKDKKVLFTLIDAADTSSILYYTLNDTRPGLLASAGMPQPEQVVKATESGDEFFTTISSEQADVFDDVDIIVTYADSEEAGRALFENDPILSKIPAVQNGNLVVLINNTPLATAANPSPLSVSWGISDYFALLNSTTSQSAN